MIGTDCIPRRTMQQDVFNCELSLTRTTLRWAVSLQKVSMCQEGVSNSESMNDNFISTWYKRQYTVPITEESHRIEALRYSNTPRSVIDTCSNGRCMKSPEIFYTLCAIAINIVLFVSIEPFAVIFNER